MSLPLPPTHTSSPLRRIASQCRKIVTRSASLAFNNVLVNNAAMALGYESWLKSWMHPYLTFRPSSSKKAQENAGFSDRPEINAVVERMHADIAQLATGRIERDPARKLRALDIGCGPGLYLQDFSPDAWSVTGLDMNPGMCELARHTCPTATIIQGSFLEHSLPDRFDLIYSISVLQYFARTSLDKLFQKLADTLMPGGLVFINYPHAISRWDLLYPDLNFIQFSPDLIQKIASRYLTIIEHRHSIDNRSIGQFDEQPYASQIPHIDKSFRNTSVLIAQRSKPDSER